MKSLNRFWESLAWKMFPRAQLTLDVGQDCVLSLKNRGDFIILREIFIDQVYAPYLQAIGQVSTWVDLGCNCGMFSLYLERAARANNWTLPRRALLVDASPVALEAAREALSLSKPKTEIRTLHAAVAGQKEFVEFFEGKTTHKSSIHSFGSRARKRRVPVVNLEKACAGFIERPDVVKIDIEGAEAELLQDWADWLRRARYLIIEWHEPYLSGPELDQRLQSLGFYHMTLPGQNSDEARLRGQTGTGLWRNSAL